MPVYFDTHEGADIPDELRRETERRIRSGQKDKFGVIDRGLIIDRQGDKMHCVLEAPSPQAILDHHRMLKVDVQKETIHEADVILK